MRCLVTGAAGFVGSHLVERLLADAHDVVGIDCFLDYYPRAVKEKNLARARNNPRFQFVEGSLLSADLPALLRGVHWIFHQAGQAGVRASWGNYFQTYTDNNVLATQRLLEAARATTGIERLVYASSSSVYGNAESYPTHEGMLPQPVSPYGVTKLAAEHLMCLYASEFGVPTVSLRYFTVFGPRQRPDMAFHRFARAALERRQIEIYGTGEQSRDFTFVSDIVQANILAAERGRSGGVYNIGGGTQATVNQVLEFIGSIVGALDVVRKPKLAGESLHTGADTTRAQRDLGYRPAVPLFEGIRREVEWMREELG